MSRFITYYGDDFTGSTDVMEALASHGISTVLFTRRPSATEFTPFADYDAMGLAGTSRSETPQWMDENLPDQFAWLKSLGARFCHYKVCSTFDSSPLIGNIGRATAIGAAVFNQAMVPLVIGAPQLGRYTFAGHLFAAYQGITYRIDRHPVMSCHPVTPMQESDVRLHLSRQSGLSAVLANAGWPESGIGLLDVHDVASQLIAGRRLLDWPGGFVVGSSGVEYALVKTMVENGTITGRAGFAPLRPVDRLVVVSGSVSPTTERQIRYAEQHGFEAVPMDTVALAVGNPDALSQAITKALSVLATGQSPLLHTALGPSSDVGKRLGTIVGGRARIGKGLGLVLKAVLEKSCLRRAVVAGGDSSSHALGQLDIFALTTRMPLPSTPGSPLCSTSSGNDKFSGVELALKGGQVGRDDYFVAMRDGRT